MQELVSINFRDDFGIVLDSLGLNGIGIEIGVRIGEFSEILLRNTKLKQICFLDAWKEYPPDLYQDLANCSQQEQDQRYAITVNKLKRYGDRARIIRKDCVDAVNDFEDCYFDFIYIDANHEYQYIKRDINDWYPKLKAGGLFSGHDYIDDCVKSNGSFGVKGAVNEFCSSHSVKPYSTLAPAHQHTPSWYFVKS